MTTTTESQAAAKPEDREYFCAYMFRTPSGDITWEHGTAAHTTAAEAISEAAAFLIANPGEYEYADLAATCRPHSNDPYEEWLNVSVRPRPPHPQQGALA